MASQLSLSLVDVNAVSKLLHKKDSHVGKVKIRKLQAKAAEKAKSEKADNGLLSDEDEPLFNHIEPSFDSELRATFESGRPFDDKINVIQCKHCKKPMLAMVANDHITVCIQKKNEKAQRKKEQKEANRKAREAQQKAERAEEEAAQDAEGDEDSINGDKSTMGKKSAVKGSAGTSKKRKADDDTDKNPKKKTKKELEAAKPKAAKPKGPVDVEKQCGVILPNGAMCARSLTCKSHAMGAKRAVPGRSLPYDMLLQAYQKKNQAKQQKAAIDANAPLIDDENDKNGPVDSDEEKDLVMAGIARARPQPIAQHVPISMRRKYQLIRVKDMIRSALGTKGSISASSGTAGAVDAEESETRRQSMPQPGSARGPGPGGLPGPQRKASIVTPATPVTAN